MKKFSDLNIKISQPTIFEAQQITIVEILNEEIEVLDFQKNVTTSYGEGRYIILIRKQGKQFKFFTDAKRIKEQLDQVNKEDLPFIAKISVQRFGDKKKTYQFT